MAIEELNWDSASCHERLKELGAIQYDYIIAADCLYTDEACPPSAWVLLTPPSHTTQLSAASFWAAVSKT